MLSSLSAVAKLVFAVVFSVILIVLTTGNLVFANVFGESCGYLHPMIFEIEVTMIRSNGTSISSSENTIPIHEPSTYVNSEAEPLFVDFDSLTGEQIIGELDTYLRVYDSAGNLIAENDDAVSLDSAIEGLDISGYETPILIEVGTYLDLSRGQFNLEVRPADAAFEPFFFENIPLSSTSTSNTIAVGEQASGTIEADQRVLYRLTGQPESGVVNVRVSGQETVFVDNSQPASVVDTRYVPGLNPDPNTEDEWASCLQYYGYFDNEQFSITQNGIARYITFSNGDALLDLIWFNFDTALAIAEVEAERVGVAWSGEVVDEVDFAQQANEAGILGQVLTSISPITKEYATRCGAEVQGNGVQITSVQIGIEDCIIDGVIALSVPGRIIFYVILPLIVILLPVLVVLGLTKNKDRLLWTVLLVLVTIHSTTTSLLFVDLARVSGIDALQDFGTGIFGGIVTGAALGFISVAVENFAGKEKEDEA